MRATQFYDFTLSANGTQTIFAAGNYFRILTSTGSIQVGAEFGQIGPLLAGQGLRNKEFTTLTIKDLTGFANKGIVIVGDQDFVDDRITGSVEIIDGGKNRSLMGQSLTAHMWSPASASNYSNCQLWNPSGSGKNIIVGQISAAPPAGTSLQVLITNTVLVNPLTAMVGNKKSNMPAGVAIAYTNTTPAIITTNVPYSIPNNSTIRMTEPFIIQPGYGINFGAPNINTSCGVDLEFFEDPI